MNIKNRNMNRNNRLLNATSMSTRGFGGKIFQAKLNPYTFIQNTRRIPTFRTTTHEIRRIFRDNSEVLSRIVNPLNRRG